MSGFVAIASQFDPSVRRPRVEAALQEHDASQEVVISELETTSLNDFRGVKVVQSLARMQVDLLDLLDPLASTREVEIYLHP